MSYLDRLKEHLSEKHPIGEPPKPPEPSFSGFSGSSGGHISPTEALRVCRLGLGSLDAEKPLHGLSPARWDQLREDAGWLFDHFAAQAFRDGWTIGELFGLWWANVAHGPQLKAGWGGLADRLQSSRSLKMTAGRACWRSAFFSTVAEQFNQGSYPDLRPLWEKPE